MDIMAEKIELIKQLLTTDDIGVIKAIKSILKTFSPKVSGLGKSSR